MAALMPLGKQQYFAASGAPLVGGKVYTYAAGTTSLLSTYSDKAGVTPNTNPVVLDSRGEATIFWGQAGYKVVLKDSTDATIWTQDNLYAVQDSSSMTFAQELITATAGQTVFNLSISYTNGTNSLAVFCNGLRLNSTDYTETSTTSVTLNTGATVGDEFLFVAGDFAASTTGADLVTYTPAGTGAVATTVQAKLRESVSVKDFGAVGDGVTDDTAAIQAACTYAGTLAAQIPAYTQANEMSGVVLEFELGKRYLVSSPISIPSRCHTVGNNAAIFSNGSHVLLNVYGFEVKISDLRLYKGTKAINFTQGNVDSSTVVIDNCSFSGQTALSIDSTGTASTHLQIQDCKFYATAPILYSDCDETSISGGWATVRTAEVSYFTATGHLILDNVLGVPSYSGTPSAAQKLATYWIQLGTASDKRGSLTCRRFRFGGEASISYIKSYAKANSTTNEILRVIDIQVCEVWATGNVDFIEIPNKFTFKNNHHAVSNQINVNASGAGSVSATSLMYLWDIDVDTLLDSAAVTYCSQPYQRNGGSKNLISTNAYFSGFSNVGALGGGSQSVEADTWPTNNIYQITFGTKTTEPQLYQTFALATGLTGKATFQILFSSNTRVELQLNIGAYVEKFRVPGDGILRPYMVQGNLTAAANSVSAAVYYVPDSTVIRMGHPQLFYGAVAPDEMVQAPNATALTLTILNGRFHASAAPTDGYWYKGTKIFNIAPTAGGYEGWVCTASGAPGTWKTFGAITP